MAYKPRVLDVSDGGSGRSSATAYAVICGGTTATGAEQSIASVGTSGQVLTSNGAGALPTMQDLPGSQSSFVAYLGSNQSNVTGDGTAYTLGTGATLTILTNNGSDFTTSGVFTAPTTGLYMFGCNVQIDGLTSGMTLGYLELSTTSRLYRSDTCNIGAIRSNGNSASLSFHCTVPMSATDTAVFIVTIFNGTLVADIAGTGGAPVERTSLYGYKVA